MSIKHRASFSLSFFLATLAAVGWAQAVSPCDNATHPNQCGWWASDALPPFVQDAIIAKGGAIGAGDVLVLTSGDPADADDMLSNPMGQIGCGTNPDGWQTYDCVQLAAFVPPQDSVVLALSSEWFEWYQTIFTDWMTISGAGVTTVDVSINSWIDNKVDVIPYGPMETGVVILSSLAASKMVDFRVADSGDSIYDTAILVVPATWFGEVSSSNADQTILCGNGLLDPGEQCDDGNSNTDDGCSSLCLGEQPSTAGTTPSQTCGNLVFVWPNGQTAPYTCGADFCTGYRCVLGDTISPACYDAGQCATACTGSCVDVQAAQLDCSVMCSVQPPATEPPPELPQTCAKLVYTWPDGTTMPYTCDDACIGQRCVVGSTVSPECWDAGECNAETCPAGICVDLPVADCADLCGLAEMPTACTAGEQGHTRPAANQKGPCLGNVEICKNLIWKLADGSWEPQDEDCNGMDDDCNGVADDMYETCGDPGLCQNTVNACDPAHPTIPVVCVTLPPPSPVEICNDGLDNDCDGSEDDGCECGDDECMPGESFLVCPVDCPPPPNGTACEDGNLCTTGDFFLAGACKPGNAVTCDDGNACVASSACDPLKGCSATKIDCDDGDPCTIDECDPLAGCYSVPDPACAGQDADGDGYIAVESGGDDCDDANDAVHPGATDGCNGVDDDCDGAVDDDAATCGCAVDGDLTGDAKNNIVDVQCSILVALWEITGGFSLPPTCLMGANTTSADINCDALRNVLDVLLTIDMVLNIAPVAELDGNGDGCIDACHVPE